MVEIVGDWGGGRIWKILGGALPSNCYIIEANVPGGCILIDTCLDSQLIDSALQNLGLNPHQIFCTHGHFDHVGSAHSLQEKYGCNVYLHKGDERVVKASNFLLMACRIDQRITLPSITYVEDEFSYRLGEDVLKFTHAPGHTPGSCIIELGNAWFTGDTIYSHGVGLSSVPGSNSEELKRSLNLIWNDLNSRRIVYPGHGAHSMGESICKNNKSLLIFLNKSN
ncbi:MBL fold metallo-hydrolase [Polynucleobacter sphagniphilus]|uniref:MBL fold metallo-hydrolase n=1 Tax=Polynucleobacter sphagniphilus TaxID=1743169 RepID=UPI002405928A|nr:MBL fold metallo-hydrolase [Polynucleobacter sphagniphilus]MDF9787839.1 hydroxyacylglutathione hydrolase [Polynucleobacter sphagniphilus]